MKNFVKITLAVFSLIAVFTTSALTQVKYGMDFYSHYIWRGADLSAQSLQPALSYTTGNLSFGAWGSFSTTNSYFENDLWGSYGIGPVAVYVTDYYIPTFLPPTATFFNYNTAKGAGSHVVEVGLGYTGPASMPISIAGYYDVIGGTPDPDNSSYIQASYPYAVDSTTTLTFTVGLTPAKSTVWYTTAKAGLINVGVQAAKTIKITDSFSLPVNAQYILNPYLEKTYLIFGISL
ncbi:MAG TPA: hypothetical protein VMM58_03700 [Bacteroidota bacterium]|nr:hypothetical protein [Bacteroidota bacterium]